MLRMKLQLTFACLLIISYAAAQKRSMLQMSPTSLLWVSDEFFQFEPDTAFIRQKGIKTVKYTLTDSTMLYKSAVDCELRYDRFGKLLEAGVWRPGGVFKTFFLYWYNEKHQVVAVCDRRGLDSTACTMNSKNQLMSEITFNAQGQEMFRIRYTWNGNKLQKQELLKSDSREISEWVYDNMGRPHIKYIKSQAGNRYFDKSEFTYDAQGRLCRQVDGGGQFKDTISYTYSEKGQLETSVITMSFDKRKDYKYYWKPDGTLSMITLISSGSKEFLAGRRLSFSYEYY